MYKIALLYKRALEPKQEPLYLTKRFKTALAQFESGDHNIPGSWNPDAINDEIGATGIYQATDQWVREANRIGKTKYTLVDMHDPAISDRAYDTTMRFHVPIVERKLGRPLTAKELYKMHYAGPGNYASTNEDVEKKATRFDAVYNSLGGAELPKERKAIRQKNPRRRMRIKAGDTIDGIGYSIPGVNRGNLGAWRKVFKRLNPKVDVNKIRVGQEIMVPLGIF